MLLPRQAAIRLFAVASLLLLAACVSGPVHHPVSPTDDRMASVRRYDLSPVSAPAATDASGGPTRLVKVALLLPLSGESAPLGNAMLDAAMLGLFDKYNSVQPAQANVKVQLLPKDTGDSPKTAELAARSAIEEGATLFLGPLFADSVKAVSPIAKAAGVPMIAFSNNPEIAAPGVYVYGFLPAQQVARVADEAYRHHRDHIAALVPANAYGKMVADALARAAADHGQAPGSIEFYPEGGDVDEAAGRLFTARDGRVKPEIDALLIAEGGDRLKAIAARLKRFGITTNRVQLLGTGLWDDPALLADPDLAGGWFAGSPKRLSAAFDTRFSAANRYPPPRLASLAYDGVALAVTLAMTAPEAHFSAAAIENPLGFSGPANGIFRFHGGRYANGVSERGLSVLKIGPRGFEEIAPAPRAFDIPLR